MNIFSTTIPLWVSIVFLLSIPIPVLMFASLVKTAALDARFDAPRAEKLKRAVIIFFAVFFLYVSILSLAGVFRANTLPPRVLLFTAIPLLSFLLLLFFSSTLFRTLLAGVRMEALVQVHLFRLIGIFFFLFSAYNLLPASFAYIAGIGDVVTALLSIAVAGALRHHKPYARALTIVWNVFGLVDILSVVSTALIITRKSIETGAQGVTEIGTFPFCFIPAFAPATIVFLHLAVFRKLMAEKNYVQTV